MTPRHTVYVSRLKDAIPFMVFEAILIDVVNKNVVKKVTHFFSFSVLTRAKLAKFTVEHFRIRRRFSSDKFGSPTKCKAIRRQIKKCRVSA